MKNLRYRVLRVHKDGVGGASGGVTPIKVLANDVAIMSGEPNKNKKTGENSTNERDNQKAEGEREIFAQ